MTARLSFRVTRLALGVVVACGVLAGGAVLGSSHPGLSAGRQFVYQRAGARAGELAAGWAVSWPVRGRLILAARVAPGMPARQAAAHARAVEAVPVSRAAPALGGCAIWNISCQVDAWFAGLIVSAIS